MSEILRMITYARDADTDYYHATLHDERDEITMLETEPRDIVDRIVSTTNQDPKCFYHVYTVRV